MLQAFLDLVVKDLLLSRYVARGNGIRNAALFLPGGLPIEELLQTHAFNTLKQEWLVHMIVIVYRLNYIQSIDQLRVVMNCRPHVHGA